MRSVRRVGVVALVGSMMLVGCEPGAPSRAGSSSGTAQATPTSPTAPEPGATPAGPTAVPPSAVNPVAPSPARPTVPPSAVAPAVPFPGPAVPASLAGRIVSRIPTTRTVVALTFDAGANGDGVDSILATLASEHVPATFYLTGRFVDHYPALARAMSAAGRLGNHSTDHPHLPTLTDAQVTAQVSDAQSTILATTGRDPRPLFRFPFGDSTSHDVGLVNSLGYVTVGWTVDTLGWQGTSGGRNVDSVVRRVLDAATPGQIVLMHVGSHPSDHSTLDADALGRIISGLRAAGYDFVTLDALTG